MTRSMPVAGLSLIAATAMAFALFPARAVHSQDEKKAEKSWPVEGAWKLVETKNGDAQEYSKLPEGFEQTKFVTGGRFIWIVVQNGEIASAAGGKYTVDKDKYTESLEYSHGEGQKSLVGKSFDFTWKVEGNSWHHVGTIKIGDQDLKIDEKWERCK